MGLYHKPTVVWTNETNTAGESGTLVSDYYTLGSWGATAEITVTNDSTAPTSPGYVQPQVSLDGTNFKDYGQAVYGNTSDDSAVTNGDVRFLPGIRYARFSVGGNDDQIVFVTVSLNPYTIGSGDGN